MESNENKFYKAKERVKELKKFYNSLFAFIIFNLFFVLINYLTNGFSYAWFWWITISWGFGMAFYAFKTFGLNFIFSKDWEDKKIREIMDKEEEKYSQESKHQKWE